MGRWSIEALHRRSGGGAWHRATACVAVLAGLWAGPAQAQGQEFVISQGPVVVTSPGPATSLCTRIELFTKAGSAQGEAAQQYLDELVRTRPGLVLEVKDVGADPAALARLKALAKQFGQKSALVPTIAAAGRVVVGFRDATNSGPQVEELLTIHAYVREGCPRCAAAMPFIGSLAGRYPGLRVVMHEVTQDPTAMPKLNQLASFYRMSAVSVPAFYAGGRLFIGYTEGITNGQIIQGLDATSAACPPVGSGSGA